MTLQLAYLDTSAFLALAFGQDKDSAISRTLEKVQAIVSSDLLISEAASAFKREGAPIELLEILLKGVTLVSEAVAVQDVKKVLSFGYLRGADTHHLACALSIAGNLASQCLFATLDSKQQKAAQKMGFAVI